MLEMPSTSSTLREKYLYFLTFPGSFDGGGSQDSKLMNRKSVRGFRLQVVRVNAFCQRIVNINDPAMTH
jgi:hypothetical protein